MAANFGTPKTGFTLPTVTTTSNASAPLQFNFTPSGAGDIKAPLSLANKPLTSGIFGAPTTNMGGFSLSLAAPTVTSAAISSSVPPNLTLGTPTTVAAPQFNLSATITPASSAPATTTAVTGFSLGAPTTTTPATGFSLGVPATTAAATGFALPQVTATATTSAPGFSLGTPATSAPLFGLGTAPSFASTTAVSSTVGTLPSTGSLTFAQLEESINKWTMDMEEQGGVFEKQAKQLNAWDSLLITNGEKILSVSNGIDRVKQQQQQLDQELDFVLAQQKELEDCIVPLEKELENVPITDTDRYDTYKLAEAIDVQMKHVSEDLKELIEHLNEYNKSQELSDPVAQIGKILNAHMNSLQWVDKNTSEISKQLDEIAKLQEVSLKNHDIKK